jgi:amino acid adenylation domain-containing protein
MNLIKRKISKIQEQFWILQNLYPDHSAYNVSTVFHFNGDLNVTIFNKAIIALINRHEILRSVYRNEDGHVFQYNVPQAEVKSPLIIKTIDADFNKRNMPGEILDEVNRPFNLTVWPLFRIKIFRFRNDSSILTIVFHHIIIDLHSKLQFGRELSELYNLYSEGKKPSVNEPNFKYSEFLNWQDKWISSSAARKAESFWQNILPEDVDILALPSDFERTMINGPIGKRIHFQVNNEVKELISLVAQKSQVNTFTILLTAYAIFLQRYSGLDKILIGVPLTNRRISDFKDTFGCFVNILPIPVDFTDRPNGAELIKQIRLMLLQAHRNQELPYLLIKESLLRNNKNVHEDIFQTGFTFEPPMELQLNNIETSYIPIEKSGAQLDLFLTMWEEGNGISGYWEYSSSRFKDKTADKMKNAFISMLDAFCKNILSDNSAKNSMSIEDIQLLNKWNSTSTEYNSEICIHHKFEEQVRKTPLATAIIYKHKSFSYIELNQQSNRLAHYLIESGISIEDKIAVCMVRCPEMLVCILAILKAGATYLPIDPNYPEDRLNFILSDANPKFVFTQKQNETHLPSRFNNISAETVLSDSLLTVQENPQTKVQSHNLAYLIYTSGSTGMPKGVLIEHHSVINKIEWMQKKHYLTENDTLLFKTPITFDVSVWEIFWWFFNGARLCILPPGEEKNPQAIAHEVSNNKVTALIFVPSMFSGFIHYIEAYDVKHYLTSLKWIIQIGETLTPQIVMDFNALCTEDFDPQLVNTYGPAEATVAVTYYDCPKELIISKVYIGKPINNTKIFIINRYNEILPIGVQGELVISGVNLARGYLNRSELNSEKFIFINGLDGNPIKVYKTGDRAKWCNHGELEFMGRMDNQVKIRGYRIELGDIEAKLLSFAKVNVAAVIVNGFNLENKHLVGYVELKESFSSSSAEIIEFLKTRLPDYMIPAQIIIMDKIPINKSEKIDRKALPLPNSVNENQLIEPGSEIENKLVTIWKEILNCDRIGVSQNFFDVGGNSILLIRLAVEIKKQLQVSVEPLIIFQYPCIAELANYISLQGSSVKVGVALKEEPIRKKDFSRFAKRNKSQSI